MNWQRWLFRFWLVLTLVWVVGGEVAFWLLLDAKWDVFWDGLIGGAWAVLVVPPVVVFVVGWYYGRSGAFDGVSGCKRPPLIRSKRLIVGSSASVSHRLAALL